MLRYILGRVGLALLVVFAAYTIAFFLLNGLPSDPVSLLLGPDASDVTADIASFRLTHPHVSTGFGIRYDTPVGPLRLDVGYRVPYLQVVGTSSVSDCSVNCSEVVVAEMTPSTFLGLPIAVAIAIGEAF